MQGLEDRKSTYRRSKIEVGRMQNRSLECFLAALGAGGRSWDHPEGVVVRLGGVLEPSWGRFGCVSDGLEAVFGSAWRHPRLSEGVLGLSASNGGRTKHSILHIVC